MMMDITKRKMVTYLGSSLGSAAVFTTVAYLRGYLPLYLFFWFCFGAVLGSCVSRVTLHLVFKDYSPEMWQVAIYHFFTGVGILGLIYSDSWGWASFSAALIVGMGLMAGGTRFIDQEGGTLMLYRIEHETRYYPKGDEPGAEDDLDRPICLYDGKALTIEEAQKAGLEGAAANARKVLADIYGIKLEEAKEEK